MMEEKANFTNDVYEVEGMEMMFIYEVDHKDALAKHMDKMWWHQWTLSLG